MNLLAELDAMDRDDLMAFWSKHRTPSREEAAALEATVGQVETLAAYACARACVLSCEAKGDDHGAKVYRQHCDIYRDQL